MADTTGPRSTGSVPGFLQRKGLVAQVREHTRRGRKRRRGRRVPPRTVREPY